MMKLRRAFFFLICLIVTFSTCDNQSLDVVAKGIQFLFQIYQYENKNDDTKRNDQKLTDQVHYLNLKNSIEELKLKIEKLQSDAPDVTNMKARMYDLQVCSDEINMRYKEYVKFSKYQTQYDKSTLQNFYKEVMNENEGVPKLLFMIHEQVVGLGYGSLLNIMDRYIEYIEPYCEKRKSRQRYFFDLFLSILSYEIRGYLVLEYAYKLKKELENKSLKQELKDMYELSRKRLNSTFWAFKEIMSRSDQSMWKCDPTKHIENESYVELKNVFRRIFYDVQEFTSPSHSFDCFSQKCPKMSKSSRIEPICKQENCFFHQRHCSNVIMCRELVKNEAYDVCVSKDQDHGRRYSYVNVESRNLFDGHAECNGQYRAVYRTVLSYPGSFSDSVCNMCDCICDESQDSDRYISLLPVISDTTNNYVITGVRFQVVNHTLYIKIQEGELLPHGFINYNSVRWKDIEAASDVQDYLDEISIFSLELLKKLVKQKKRVHTSYTTNGFDPRKYDGRGKFKLDWFDGRGVYLDNLEVKKGEIVTGVRFTLDYTQDGKISAMLDLQATPFDYTKSKLLTENSYWISTFTSSPIRTPLVIKKKEVPTLLNVFNEPDDVPNKYIEFAPSAFTSKDAGQTLLPLIDIQPVTSDPPVPLMGISLDVKKANDSGGFLMLKTKTYNSLWHLDDYN